jgi:hypothetical protein
MNGLQEWYWSSGGHRRPWDVAPAPCTGHLVVIDVHFGTNGARLGGRIAACIHNQDEGWWGPGKMRWEDGMDER